jgi:hypothetical protein
MEIHFFHCIHGRKRMALHDIVRDAFATITKYVDFIFHKNKQVVSFCPLPYNLHIIELTLCY